MNGVNQGRRWDSTRSGRRESGGRPIASGGVDIKIGRDEPGRIDVRSFLDEANGYAEDVAKESTTFTQLRRFYDQFLKIKDGVKSETLSWRDAEVMIRMIKVQAEYSNNRGGPNKGPLKKSAKDLVVKMVDECKSEEDFFDICTCFEGFVGYYRVYAKK